MPTSPPGHPGRITLSDASSTARHRYSRARGLTSRALSSSLTTSIPTTDPGDILTPPRQRCFRRDLADIGAARLVESGDTRRRRAHLDCNLRRQTFAEAHALLRLP